MATHTSPAFITPQYPTGSRVRSSNPHEPLQILRSAQGLEKVDPVTIGQMFQDTVKIFPKKTALCFKETGDSDWKEISFAKYYSFTTQAARSLLKVLYRFVDCTAGDVINTK